MADIIETAEEIARPLPSKFWMRDSAGHPSVMITFVFISFWITTIIYILSIFTKIGKFEIRAFDSGASAAYFGIILTAYIARRATDAKWGNPNIPTYITSTPDVQMPVPLVNSNPVNPVQPH